MQLNWTYKLDVLDKTERIHVQIQKNLSGRVLTTFFSHQRISQSAMWTSLEKLLDPWGPIASQGWSVPEFLRNSLATSDFP